MIRIVRAKALASLRAEVAQAGEFRCQAAEAHADAERARAELRALCDDTVMKLVSLKAATGHPDSGTRFQADIALCFLRLQIGKIKSAGDPAAIEAIQIIDYLIGNDFQVRDQEGFGGKVREP